jgi:hypothetical protein
MDETCKSKSDTILRNFLLEVYEHILLVFHDTSYGLHIPLLTADAATIKQRYI